MSPLDVALAALSAALAAVAVVLAVLRKPPLAPPAHEVVAEVRDLIVGHERLSSVEIRVDAHARRLDDHQHELDRLSGRHSTAPHRLHQSGDYGPAEPHANPGKGKR